MVDLDDPIVRYLLRGRDAMRWKLDGLSDYDLRRPLTPTATNLLGLAKHVASVVVEYVTVPFGRPNPVELPWTEPEADMWVPADESTAMILDLWDRAWEEVTVAISELDPGTPGDVPWWGEQRHTTFGRILVHCVAEVHRHAGHADIVRELVDGSVGHSAQNPNLPRNGSDEGGWATLHAQVQAAADALR